MRQCNVLFQLIRTTYWTRFSTEKRFDEIEEATNQSNSTTAKCATNGNYLDNMSIESEVSKPKQSLLRQFATWFCGIKNTSSEAAVVHSESEVNISSIEQDSRAQKFLFASLLLVIAVAITLFITLSIPGWWTILE